MERFSFLYGIRYLHLMKRWQAWLFYVVVFVTAALLREPLFGDTGSNALLTIGYYLLACLVSWLFYFSCIGFVYTLSRAPAWIRRHRSLKQEISALEDELRKDVENITSGEQRRS